MSISVAQQHFSDAEEFWKKGLLQDAIASYKKAIEEDATFVSAYYNLALAYHQAQQPIHAVTNLKKVTELDTGDASAFNNLGVLYVAMNRLYEAKKCFEKALLIEGGYQDARDNLEKVLQKLQIARFHTCNVGFVSLWYERGQAYITKAVRDALGSEYNTFVFARNGGDPGNPLLQTTGEWDVPNLTSYPEYKIPHDMLKDWIVKNGITAVFFNEEYDLQLVEVAKRCGAKIFGYYVWELFDPLYVPGCQSLYDKIICPTKACYEKFINLGLNNVEYVQWGVDLNVFEPKERIDDKRVKFFHPAGWGGMHARRGTQLVVDAFQKLNDPNTELLIHTQRTQCGFNVQESKNIKILFGTVPREEIVRMYQASDVAVLPSKWEGLGLTFLESIGCGLPIITVDAPPMNEFVHDGETGFLCRVAERKNYQRIFVEGVHVDVDDMAEKMQTLAKNDVLRKKMRETTCSQLRQSFNLDIFYSKIKKIFLSIMPNLPLQNNVIVRTNRKECPYSITLCSNSPNESDANTFGAGQVVESDSAEYLHSFDSCPINTNLIKNIIESRTKHIIEFTGVGTDNIQQLAIEAGKHGEKEWFRFITSGQPVKDYYCNLPKTVLFSYANVDSSGSHWRLEYVIRLLLPFISSKSAFLDFGSGIGEVGIYFSKICKVTVYDVPGHTQDFVKYHAHELNATMSYLNDLNDIKESAFDVISAQDVLEHIENPMDVVEKLFCALKPGGYFITSGFWFNPNVSGHLSSNIQYRNTWITDFEHIGFKYICKYSGSNWAVAVFKKQDNAVVNPGQLIGDDSSPTNKVKLMSKDYTGCQLVRKEDGLQFIKKGNEEEPFVVHLVGAQWSNHPWGMENEIHRALEKYGVTIIDTDFRRDFDRLPDLFRQKAHLMLVVKGNGIPPELISKQPCKTVLWYQDDVFSTEHASKHIAYNGWAFDTVYSFDEMALDRYRELGVKDARYLPLAMSPEVHRKMFLTKKTHDICFVGNVYPNRKALLERLAKRFDLFVTRAFMDDMVKIFNESKIVLNLGVGHTGIQQRVFEALGCGSFLLTNSVLEKSPLFKDRVHLVYFQDANIEELVEHYLLNDEERETIALAGYREVNAGHAFHHRIQKILKDVFCREVLSVQPTTEVKRADDYGKLDTSLTPTLSVVVSTYNRKPLLQECINNLLKNSAPNIEIVVVDDPCADGAREWLDEMKTKFKNLVLIHNQQHEGIQKSVNIGFAATTGQYVGAISDDVEVTKGWDSPLVALLESDPCHGAATPLILDKNGHVYSMGLIEGVMSRKYPQLKPLTGTKGFFPKGKNPDQVPECKFVREVEYGCYWVMKREVWEKIGGIDASFGKYCGDPDYGIRVRLAGYKNLYCPTSVIVDHGLTSMSREALSALEKSQKMFFAKWDAYVNNTNQVLPKKHKILVALTVDIKEVKPGIRKAVELLSKQYPVNLVICADLTAKMDMDVMNHMFCEGVSTLQPDILLILGGKDIYPRMLWKLKRLLGLTCMLWWHSDMGDNSEEMPEWAIKLNGETDVCFISGASLDYVKSAEAKGVERGFWLDREEGISDAMFSVLGNNVKDRLLLYHDEMIRLVDRHSEQDIVDISKLLIERGLGDVALPYLEKVIQDNRNNSDAYLLLSNQFYKQGNGVESVEILRSALNASFPLAPVYHQLGKVCFALGSVNEAEKWLKTTLNQNYDDPEIYNILGQISSQKGDLAEAEKWLLAGMVKSPNNVAGLLLLGKMYRELGRVDESILCFQQCLSIDVDRYYEDEIRKNLEDLYSVKKVNYDASNILLSVIIFSFNRAEYMARTLYLFSKQTFPHRAFEIIIIDSSNDNTRDVIRKAITEYGLNIRYFFAPPPTHGLGTGSSWNNKSIKLARGNVVLYSHPEMLFSERMLEEFYKPHIFEDNLWVGGRIGVVYTKEEQTKIDPVWNKGLEYLLANHSLGKEMFRLGYKYWVQLLVSFKRDTFLRIGGYTENLPTPHHLDLDLFFRMLAIGFSVHNPPGFQGIHQWHTPYEERGKDILELSSKTRQFVYALRRAFLKGEVSAEKYAIRNVGKEFGVAPELEEESII